MWAMIRMLLWLTMAGLFIPLSKIAPQEGGHRVTLAFLLGAVAVVFFPKEATQELVAKRPRTKSQWIVAIQGKMKSLVRPLLILTPSAVGFALVVTTDFNNEGTETAIAYGSLLASFFVYCVVYEGTYLNKGRNRL